MEEFAKPDRALAPHKALVLLQVFLPKDVLAVKPPFTRVQLSLGSGNDLSQADESPSYTGNVRIEAPRMSYKT